MKQIRIVNKKGSTRRTNTIQSQRSPELKPEEASGGQPNYLGLVKAIRKLRIAGIFQHYYPEGGWGYIIILCALVVQMLSPGFQFSLGMVMTNVLTRRQSINPVTLTQAGKKRLKNYCCTKVGTCFSFINKSSIIRAQESFFYS